MTVDVGTDEGVVVYGGANGVDDVDSWDMVLGAMIGWGGIGIAGVMAGVGGPEDIGEGGCTIHMLRKT